MRAPPFVDPRKCTIALDAGVLTRKGWVRTRLAGRFRTLRAAGAFRVVMVGGGSDEAKLTGGTTGAPPDLQEVLLEVLHELLQGRHPEDDCPHPFDQLDPRTSYFVTDDYRVLQNRNLFLEEQPALIAVTLEEFFEIYQRWVNWNS